MAKDTTKSGNGKEGNGKAPMFSLDESAARPASPLEIKNAIETFEKIKNGAFQDALGYSGGGGFPFNQGVPGTAPVEQANTLFKNLRYYLVSNFRQLLNQCYVEIGLIQTIVDVPVDDGLRGGIKIKSKQLDEDQIEELQASLDRDDDVNTAGQAAKWNRLFGGAGLIIVTDQDPASELNVKAITKDTPLQFKAVDMWELFWDQQNVEGGLNLSGEQTDFEFYSYYSVNLHKSRVMPLKGLVAPSFIRPRLRGWGFSVVEALVRSINQYLKATELGFEVLDEFKLDVYKIKNLVNTLISPNGAQKVKERVALANWQKNYQNAVVMDSEDDFDHKQLSFAGLGEAMDGIRMQVAADMRMPRSKLFGEAGGGLNSGSLEGDLKVYNSMVEGQVRNKIKYHLVRIVEIKCQKLFGMVPDDIKLEFHPLEVLNAEQEENVKNAKFNRLLSAKGAGEITTFEFREGCNRDNLLSISLDTAGDNLNPEDPDVQALVDGTDEENDAESDGEGKKDADKGNEGADKPDAERPQLKKNEKVKNDAFADFQGPKIVTVGLVSGLHLLTGRRRDNGLWTSPGGHMDANETPEQAACREVKEECGIQVMPEDLKPIGCEKIVSHRTGKEFVLYSYLATIDDTRHASGFDPDQEVSEWKWVSIDQRTPELQPEARHAKADAVLSHLFKLKNGYENSLGYEIAAFSTDSETEPFDDRRAPFLEKREKDPLWKRALARAAEAGKGMAFADWWYRREGGKLV